MDHDYISFDDLSPAEANEQYPVFYALLLSFGLSPEHAAKAVMVGTQLCSYCWESGSGCQCMNDE